MSQSRVITPKIPSRPAQAKRRKQLSPGPPWPTALWNTIRFGRDPLSFLRELRERYGDLVTLPTIIGRRDPTLPNQRPDAREATTLAMAIGVNISASRRAE